jgi:hypothetical protein
MEGDSSAGFGEPPHVWLRTDETVEVRTDIGAPSGPHPTVPRPDPRADDLLLCLDAATCCQFEPSNDVALTYKPQVIGMMNERTTSPRSSSRATASTGRRSALSERAAFGDGGERRSVLSAKLCGYLDVAAVRLQLGRRLLRLELQPPGAHQGTLRPRQRLPLPAIAPAGEVPTRLVVPKTRGRPGVSLVPR